MIIPGWRQDRRRAVLERRVALWEERVKQNASLKPQLDHHREKLEQFNAEYDTSGG